MHLKSLCKARLRSPGRWGEHAPHSSRAVIALLIVLLLSPCFYRFNEQPFTCCQFLAFLFPLSPGESNQPFLLSHLPSSGSTCRAHSRAGLPGTRGAPEGTQGDAASARGWELVLKPQLRLLGLASPWLGAAAVNAAPIAPLALMPLHQPVLLRAPCGARLAGDTHVVTLGRAPAVLWLLGHLVHRLTQEPGNTPRLWPRWQCGTGQTQPRAPHCRQHPASPCPPSTGPPLSPPEQHPWAALTRYPGCCLAWE